MKRTTTITILTAALLAAFPLQAQTNRTADTQFKAAEHKEQVEGDLKGAIEQYKQIAQSKDRAIAVQALIRMAECYQKLGNAESRKIYEQVVKEFADQREAVAVAQARLGRQAGTESRMALRQVWKSLPRASIEGAISRDGRYLPYVDWEQSGNLFLHDFSSGSNRRLTDWETNSLTQPKGRQFAAEARLSRDGRHLAYSWFRSAPSHPGRYELRITDLQDDGLPRPRILFGNPEVSWIGPGDWSPDGKAIAVMIERTDRTGQIGLVSVSDGALRILRSVDWRGARGVSFSPDGKYLGFDLPQNDSRSERDVFVLSVDGAREVHAVAHSSNDVMIGWSPDGRWLLFASDRTGSMGLWGLPFSGGKPAGAPESLKADMTGRLQPLGVTDAGALHYMIASGQDRFKIQLASFDFAAGKFLSGPTDLTQDYLESNLLPSWSPDGRRLAYVSTRGPAERATDRVLVIRSLESGEIKELRPKLNYFGLTSWAPDGEFLMMNGRDLKGRNGLFQVDGKTGDVSTFLLDQPGEKTWGTWGGGYSRDGKNVYFRRDYRATRDSAYIQREIATGRETEFFRKSVLSIPSMSPDGRYVATRSVDESTNSRTLLLISVPGREIRELVRYPSELPARQLADETKGIWLQPIHWAPDSRSFLARKTRSSLGLNDEGFETWRIPIDGTAPQKLEENFLRSGWSQGPDGRVAITVIEKTPRRDPEVWVLENFLPTVAANK